MLRRMMILSLALWCCAGVAAGAKAAERLLIQGAYVVDPASDQALKVQDILIVGGRVARVAPSIMAGRDVRVISARGRYATPGLWDMHAHIAALNPVGQKPEGYVGHGVLGARDMGGHLPQLLKLRRELRQGRLGPELVIAGPTLNGEAFADFHREVRTPEAGRQAVRELKRQGVDLIKVHRATKREVFLAITDEARRAGLTVSGHVPLDMKWAEAATAGIHSIEHAQTLVENEVTDLRSFPQIAEAVARLEGPYGQTMWSKLAGAGVYFDPTLITYKVSMERAEPRLAASRRLLYGRLTGMVKQAADAGVIIVTGTDITEQPGSHLVRELEELVASGLSPAQVLRAATTDSALAAGRPGMARITPGSTASILLLESDPTRDVAAFKRLFGVVLRGRWLDAAELGRLRASDR